MKTAKTWLDPQNSTEQLPRGNRQFQNDFQMQKQKRYSYLFASAASNGLFLRHDSDWSPEGCLLILSRVRAPNAHFRKLHHCTTRAASTYHYTYALLCRSAQQPSEALSPEHLTLRQAWSTNSPSPTRRCSRLFSAPIRRPSRALMLKPSFYCSNRPSSNALVPTSRFASLLETRSCRFTKHCMLASLGIRNVDLGSSTTSLSRPPTGPRLWGNTWRPSRRNRATAAAESVSRDGDCIFSTSSTMSSTIWSLGLTTIN